MSDQPLFPIEQEIRKAIKKAIPDNWKDMLLSERTLIIKQTLTDLGNGKGLAVFASGTNLEGVAGPEWLCDLIWSIENEEIFAGLKLACEIEWNTDPEDVLHDFYKLTVIVADYRLLVFRDIGYANTNEIIMSAKDACPGSKGFRYLLVGIPEKKEEDLRDEAFTL